MVATLLLGGCNWGVLDPQGPIGEAERSLIIEATLLMLVIVVPVMVLVGAFAWRYCASHARAKYMPDWEHSNAVAAVMVLTPVTVASILAVMAWQASHRLDPFKPIESDSQAVAIDVWWRSIGSGYSSTRSCASPRSMKSRSRSTCRSTSGSRPRR